MAGTERLIDLLNAYYHGIASEEYDDIVRRPSGLVVPLVCMVFDRYGSEEDSSGEVPFHMPIPISTTGKEIREALASMPDEGGKWGRSYQSHVVSHLSRRYEEDGVMEFLGQKEVPAQIFHSEPFWSFAGVILMEEGPWCPYLDIRYSPTPNYRRIEMEDDENVESVILRLSYAGHLRSSWFTMPASIFEE
ncbi:MAG: hypothetical protein IJ113_01665 [Eggerthellaceae bacterium]|nr:hypothetical protein [Eggerthellaceae bacterium]